jgi:hypothetical protein
MKRMRERRIIMHEESEEDVQAEAKVVANVRLAVTKMK